MELLFFLFEVFKENICIFWGIRNVVICSLYVFVKMDFFFCFVRRCVFMLFFYYVFGWFYNRWIVVSDVWGCIFFVYFFVYLSEMICFINVGLIVLYWIGCCVDRLVFYVFKRLCWGFVLCVILIFIIIEYGERYWFV